MIKTEIAADSISPTGNRITSFVLTFPRMVHAELMTHRIFSRNAASSRAIPTKKFVEDVQTNPAGPVFWAKNQSGMQAVEELDGTEKTHTPWDFDGEGEPETTPLQNAKVIWLSARDAMINHHRGLVECGVHKQIANRILEPWFHISVLVTSTDFLNFFALRAHPAAQQEIQAVADALLYKYVHSTPKFVDYGQWHIPFGDRMDPEWSWEIQKKVGVARAARLSYKTFDGEISLEKDLALHDSLAQSGHWSPFEHVARPIGKDYRQRSGNFVGWCQYRKDFPNESRTVDPANLLAERIAAGSKYAVEHPENVI